VLKSTLKGYDGLFVLQAENVRRDTNAGLEVLRVVFLTMMPSHALRADALSWVP
jgi:hypothetical protein